jgi:hypothetical protein
MKQSANAHKHKHTDIHLQTHIQLRREIQAQSEPERTKEPPSLDTEKVQEMREIFAMYDVEGTGKLTYEVSVTATVTAMVNCVTWLWVMLTLALLMREIFAIYDVEGTGKLTYEVSVTWL